MTEEAAAIPGWVETRLDHAFAALSGFPDRTTARARYLDCLAASKAPAAPSDMLGAEFNSCAGALLAALRDSGLSPEATQSFRAELEAIEAEIASES